jgi:hypothetical protein
LIRLANFASAICGRDGCRSALETFYRTDANDLIPEIAAPPLS